MICPKCKSECFQEAICMTAWYECPICKWNDLEELWKPVLNYNRFYEVSSFGEIRSCTRTIVDAIGRKFKKKGKILKKCIRKKSQSYLYVNLSKGGIAVKNSIHILVMGAFGKLTKGKEVNHKDGNPKNNNLPNLEMNTRKENIHHKLYKLGRVKYSFRKRGVWENTRGFKTKYVAEIRYREKKYNLGCYEDKDAAYAAYYEKYVELYGRQPW